MKIKPGAKIEFGDVGFDDIDFSPEATRRRVPLMLSERVLERATRIAESEGRTFGGYLEGVLEGWILNEN